MKSIIFNTETAKAVLDGRQTQIRLPVKIKNKLTRDWAENTGVEWIKQQNEEKYRYAIRERNGGWAEYDLKTFIESYSKYKVDDILYVKETFNDEGWEYQTPLIFKADIEEKYLKQHWWKPSVYLKQKDARIFLKVTKVRVKRLEENSYIFVYEFEKINKEG